MENTVGKSQVAKKEMIKISKLKSVALTIVSSTSDREGTPCKPISILSRDSTLDPSAPSPGEPG